MSVAEKDFPLGDDYVLIDFGHNSASPLIGPLPIADAASPTAGQVICRDGTRTGTGSAGAGAVAGGGRPPGARAPTGDEELVMSEAATGE